MKILGLSCYYHDSAAAAVTDAGIAFALQEERASRLKNDSRFPVLAIARALEFCKTSINDFEDIVFYETPEIKLQRLWGQILDDWPNSRGLFFERVPYFIHHKYPIERQIRESLNYRGTVSLCEHHRSHAAAAFYTSPFERAAVLTVDGVGEFDTTAVWIGEGNALRKVRSIRFPDSLGLFYSVFTQYLGFEVNEGEYKVMGLAPYGEPRFYDRIVGPVLRLHGDGSFSLDRRFFRFSDSERHYSDHLTRHLGIPPRARGSAMTQAHQDLAASVQKALEAALANIVRSVIAEYTIRDFCFAGGVALNCTANAALIREFSIRSHIHPAAGDAGGALGAALDLAVKRERSGEVKRFAFSPYLGVAHSDVIIEASLRINGLAFRRAENVAEEIAEALASGKVVAIVHGRDEWGPRALGGRSILADPRPAEMKEHLNAKIKFREEFRPFAPVVMEEFYADWFETLGMAASPHMLYTHRSIAAARVPAVSHVDGTSRAQTVSREQNPYLYDILAAFNRRTGTPVLINTSFNLKGEPNVSSPTDALKTFYASGIDVLAIENYLLFK
jgi:carbamoyltransferase